MHSGKLGVCSHCKKHPANPCVSVCAIVASVCLSVCTVWWLFTNRKWLSRSFAPGSTQKRFCEHEDEIEISSYYGSHRFFSCVGETNDFVQNVWGYCRGRYVKSTLFFWASQSFAFLCVLRTNHSLWLRMLLSGIIHDYLASSKVWWGGTQAQGVNYCDFCSVIFVILSGSFTRFWSRAGQSHCKVYSLFMCQGRVLQ